MSEKSNDILGLLVKKSLDIPGARVDRDQFLKEHLSLYVPEEIVQKAISANPSSAGIPENLIDELAKHSIRFHVKAATAFSAAAGLPGGLWMAGSIPADTIQFYGHIIILSQKLAYLYGWPNLDDKENVDQLKDMLIMFLGVMMGIAQFNKLISEVSRRLAIEIAKRVPRMALTKTAWFPIVKTAGKWLGVKVVKDVAAKGIAKVIPFLGAITSGTLTYFTMRGMARKLQKELKNSPLANMENAESLKKSDENEPINVEFEELEV